MKTMWSILRKLFGIRSDVDVRETDEGSVQTDGTNDENLEKEIESSDERKFDITGCEDIEIEEIDGELH